MNRKDQADPSEFRTRLVTRFQTGELRINAVLSDGSRLSDEYIVFRLCEISKKPMDRVMAEYKFSKKKGWDVAANRLRIDSGSKEFQALKTVHDLYDGNDEGKRKRNKRSITGGNSRLSPSLPIFSIVVRSMCIHGLGFVIEALPGKMPMLGMAQTAAG